MNTNTYKGVIISAIVIPFVVQTLTGWGFSEGCSNEITSIVGGYWPSLLAVVTTATAHVSNVIHGKRTLGGAKI